METPEQPLLCEQAFIESINGQLKNISQIEHSHQRSVEKFLLIYWLGCDCLHASIQETFSAFGTLLSFRCILKHNSDYNKAYTSQGQHKWTLLGNTYY